MSPPESLKQKLIERLDVLSEIRLQEVLDFVDFLNTRDQCDEDPILQVAGCLSVCFRSTCVNLDSHSSTVILMKGTR